VIEIFTALAGFDYVLEHKAEYNIRVVNCSWGNIVPGFDEHNPVNQATKRVHDAGVAVVFASGNSGSTTNTLNTYSVAPWVIGVAAGDKDGRSVSFFSSRGIPGDSFFHPTLTAPGYLIVSDRTATGAAVNATSTPSDPLFIQPQHLPYYTTASGTSMAAPHVAGTIALMLQAKPSLTPDVIKRVLINTATPMPQWQEYAAGAGYLNAKAAVEAARSIEKIRKYRDPKTGREEQVYDVSQTWQGSVSASLPGIPSVDRHNISVVGGTLSLDVAVDWNVVANDLSLYLYAPDGTLAAKSEVIQAVYNYANETVHVDHPAPGTWRVEVRGLLNAPQSYTGTSNAVVLVNPDAR
jgi:serine protease AprX